MESDQEIAGELESRDKPINIGCLPALLLPGLLILGWMLTVPSMAAIPLALLIPYGFVPYLEAMGLSSSLAGCFAVPVFSSYLIAAVVAGVLRTWSATIICCAVIIGLFTLNVKGCRHMCMQWDSPPTAE